MQINEWVLNQYKKNKEQSNEEKSEKNSGTSNEGDKDFYVQHSTLSQSNFQKENSKNQNQSQPLFKNVNREIGEILKDKAKETSDFDFQQKLIKVPKEEGPKKESIYRRVAKFLVVIGVDEAAKILPHLTAEQTDKIIPEIASISYVSDEEAAAVIEEFKSLMEKAKEGGGVDTARNILTKAYGSKKAEELLNKSVAFPDGKPFDFLSEADSDRINLLLSGEGGQVKALVLSQLDAKQAAAVINKMDDDDKKDVILRLAKMKPVAPEVIKEIAKTIEKKFQAQNTEQSQSLDGKSILAEILRRMDPAQETSLIKTLADGDPDLGEDLRKRLFTEDDVLNSDDRYLQKKLQAMDSKEIAVLVKGKNENFRNKIFSNISKTRGDVVLEEESLLTSLSKSESERVTSQFFSSLRRAWENGELRILNRDDGEVYV